MEINYEEDSCRVEIPEGDSMVLASMKKEISRINTDVSGEPAANTNASIFQDHKTVMELRVGLSGANSKSELKMQCLAHLIKQSGKRLEEYWQGMRSLEEEVRKCYGSSSSSWTSDDILKSMILDGCFILEFFQFQFFMSQQNKTIIKDHPIALMEKRKLSIIFRDLFQLGNQIPFQVLEGLFEICDHVFQIKGDNTLTVKERLLNIIGAVSLDTLGVGRNYVRRFASDPERFKRRFQFGGLEPKHLLDLIRLCFVSPHLVKQDAPGDLPQWNFTLFGCNISCISKLCLAGVKVNQQNQDLTLRGGSIPCISKLRLAGIKVNQQNRDHYLEVAFQAGAIKMPKIILNESMCSFLRNCVILENGYTIATNCFSSYVRLLDYLVDTAEDVGYLRQCHVLEHHKRTDADAAEFINSLGKHINIDHADSNFFKLCNNVNKYYENEPRKKWIGFKKEYFDKPWMLISVFAGLVLFILTFLQTYYTMRSYLDPQN